MRPRLIIAVSTAWVLVPATAALAHPSFNPNAVPAGEAVESTLVVPHGCAPGGGMPDGDSVPTTRLDLGYTDQVVIEPADVEGWEVTDDGEAIVWTDAGGATTEPIELPVTVTVTDGAEGDEIFLPAYQECEDGSSFRWVATPDEGDGYPAVKLELTSGPPATVEVEEGDHGTSPAPTGTATPATTPEVHAPTDVATSSPAPAMASDELGDTGGIMPVVLAVGAGLVLLGGAVAVRRRRST